VPLGSSKSRRSPSNEPYRDCAMMMWGGEKLWWFCEMYKEIAEEMHK